MSQLMSSAEARRHAVGSPRQPRRRRRAVGGRRARCAAADDVGQDAPILQRDIFSGASRFVASEQEAVEHGGKGIIEFWRRLGLTFRTNPTTPRLVRPRSNLKEDWFIEQAADPGRYEQLWGEAENAVKAAFREIDAHTGSSAVGAQAARAISDFMALHLIRSLAAEGLWERSRSRVVPRRREAMIVNQDLVALARGTGEYPKEWTPERIIDDITSTFEEPLRKGGEAFGDTLADLYKNVREHFRDLHLEIGEAVEGEYLLADVPCVPYKSETDEVGLMAGFGLQRADAITIPLGPRHVASLVTRPPPTPWWELDAAQVEPINRASARVAVHAVYFRPGSGLDEFANSVWTADAR